MNRIAYVLPDDGDDDRYSRNRPSFLSRVYRSTVTVLTMVLGIITLCALCFMLYLSLNKDKIPYVTSQLTVTIAKVTGKTPDEIDELRRQAAKRTSIYLPNHETLATVSQPTEPQVQDDVELIQVGRIPGEVAALKSIGKFSNAQLNNAIKIVAEAGKYNLEPLFVLALAYSDSHLNEKAESLDGIGLISIKADDAAQVAKLKGLSYDGAESLKDADTNIKINLTRLAELDKLFHGNKELMLYGKFLGKKKLLSLLADSQDIPDTASRYAQRVLFSYGDLQNRAEMYL